MTSLPARHPRMALHLTDRALTPIISSSSSSPHSSSADDASALQALATTAFASHDTAQRLGLGPPTRLIVEYEPSSPSPSPSSPTATTTTAGPIVLHSFLDPTADTASPSSTPTPTPPPPPTATAGATEAQRGPGASVNGVSSPATTTAATSAAGESSQPQPSLSSAAPPGAPPSSSGAGTVGGSSSAAEAGVPALLAMVVAPGPEDLREARQAVARLERVGREFQQEIASEQRRAEGGGA
ncbi:uncharacterized protein E0L32_008350 [Thyridium curvatum]|uniref:Uncharacterized protein n=1 Tax=Thyridium curvatum TaxID=1093900 RepID=A0A507B0X7_9PEZI|nr:uncharacterized protein E0L32_008350 [Thyridium curvatum]TPX10781.1 hypothetical protein E0L32_008350 [Thyridium curvatum]